MNDSVAHSTFKIATNLTIFQRIIVKISIDLTNHYHLHCHRCHTY